MCKLVKRALFHHVLGTQRLFYRYLLNWIKLNTLVKQLAWCLPHSKCLIAIIILLFKRLLSLVFDSSVTIVIEVTRLGNIK